MNGGWNDSAGTNHGTAYNSPTFTTSSKIGSHAGTFGTTKYAQTAATTTINPTAAISIQAWVNPSAALPNNGILNKGSFANSQGEFSLIVYGSTIYFRLNDSAGAVVATATLAQGQWTHILATYDGATMRLYVNGTLLASSAYSAAITSANTPLTIGGYYSSGYTFLGSIDEVAVWSVALTATEVETLYARQSAKYSGTFTSRAMDALAIGMSWTTLSWIPTLPFFKELPDYTSGAIQNESSTDYSSLVGSTGATGDNNLMSGITGLWHLNESATGGGGANKDFADDSGNLNWGGKNGTLEMGGPGRMDRAPLLDGSTAYILFPDNVYNSQTQGSISAWVLLTSQLATNSTGTIFSTASTTVVNSLFAFDVFADSATTMKARVGARTNLNYLKGSTNLDVGIWYHIVLTGSGTTWRLYVNGMLQTPTILFGTNAGTWFSGEVSGNMRYSSGAILRSSGTIGYFPGRIDELALWNRTLHASEIQQLYRRGANRLKHQVRVCTAADCSDDSTGANWKGPDGTNQTYFSELNNNTVPLAMSGDVKKGLPSMLFSSFTNPVGTSRYFQYRTILESDDTGTSCNYGAGATWCSPELRSVTVDPIHYDSSAPTIIGKNGVSYYSLGSFTASLGTGGCGSGVLYNLGVGSSSATATWYWWNGTAWVTANGTVANANTSAVINTNASTFGAQLGTGIVYFKAFLQSSGSTSCALDNVLINGQQ